MSTPNHFEIQVITALFPSQRELVSKKAPRGELMAHVSGSVCCLRPNSKQLCKSVKKPKLRTRTSQKSFRTGSSDDECDRTTTSSVFSKLHSNLICLCLLLYFLGLFVIKMVNGRHSKCLAITLHSPIHAQTHQWAAVVMQVPV